MKSNYREDCRMTDLISLTVRPIKRLVRRWYYRALAHHFVASAAAEAELMHQAQRNQAYFQRRAALARAEVRK